MSVEKSSPKMFVQIVKELRDIIKVEEIQPGGKLPSERVLAERLGVGRSSVREALRSMELLGLIETRRGGGTFLADFKNHQLVEIVSTFILQEEKDLENVHHTQQILERYAIEEITSDEHLRQLPVWESLLYNVLTDGQIDREMLVRELMVSSHNRLVLKIWMLLNQFGKFMYKGQSTEDEKNAIATFLTELQMGHTAEAIETFEEWTLILLKKGRE